MWKQKTESNIAEWCWLLCCYAAYTEIKAESMLLCYYDIMILSREVKAKKVVRCYAFTLLCNIIRDQKAESNNMNTNLWLNANLPS